MRLAARSSLACCLLAPCLLVSPRAKAVEAFPDEATIRRELQAFTDLHRGAPGIVVGILEPGRRVVVAEGRSGRPERQALDGTTRFEIGSITKTFTGVLFADMLLAGEVTADQRVGTLLPGDVSIANGVENATLEQLATHSSGLPRLALGFPTLTRIFSVDPYRGSTAADVLRAVASVPGSRPGKPGRFAYSNLGFALLGRLLEGEAAQPYERLLRARVLEPLGLGSMHVAHAEPAPALLAVGHGAGGRPVPYWHLDGYAPAGCLIASTDEMLRYIELNLNGRHPALVEAQRPRLTLPKGRAVGLGWMHDSIAGRHVVWHNGGTGGFRSYVCFLPEERRGLVVIANGRGNVDALARRLLDPAAPPLRAHRPRLAGLAGTIALLVWGPLLLFGSIRVSGAAVRPPATDPGDSVPSLHAGAAASSAARRRVPLDRIDVLLRPLSPAIALVLAERAGAWLDLPFALWWGSLALVLAGCALLAWRARWLPWWRSGVRSSIGRGLITALEVGALVVVLR